MCHPLPCSWFPLACKGAQTPLRLVGTHITAVVRLCSSFGSFCKWILPRKPFAEPSLPLPPRRATPGPALPHLCLLQLPLLPGQRAGAKAPHQHPSWALPTCSTCEELTFGAQPSPGVHCPHLMIHTGDLLGSLLQTLSWGGITGAAGGVVMQVILSGA